MIVVCPSCRSKYSVQPEAIGESKMVRCALCSTMWRQTAISESIDKKDHVQHIIKWAFFWFSVLAFVFSLFFTRNVVLKVWPQSACFYDFIGVKLPDTKKTFIIKNMGTQFKRRDGKLYMRLSGELINCSSDVQIMPSLIITLKNEDSQSNEASKEPYKKVWTHDLMYNKLLPDQNVAFETEEQSVPCSNLMCDIKLDVL
ncbi:hypothetical protein FACS189449_03960 [Alphaproteobacteria bacterium]|nr:hypothetical protein FACS189449_03960 [Alphaproteobacteria bacterium]